MTNHPAPVRSILCRFHQHRISHEAALSLLLSVGVLPADARYYLQAGGYEPTWEVA